MKLNVLFVCLGNICRSPMAEGIFIELLEKHDMHAHFNVDSAGTSNYHSGSLPDFRMRQKAKEYGMTLTHFARQIHKEDLQSFDYIIAMDQSNFKDIHSLKGENEAKAEILLMRSFDTSKTSDDVPDPYYGGEEGFTEVYQILLRSNAEFLNFLIRKHKLI